ncbi:MAG: DNA repair protein RecN [Oscillospiraceae bacterium]|nr:DNA repair protein RecN [Oscillospiraceae bacterium]
MLRELRIENIAVIEHADIPFGPGLNVMTGETGAGKSIVIDSIAAVTGARTSRELIRAGAERATVTAVFDRQNAEDWLRENDIDCDDEELIVQRRITAEGKSSCRVCGYPVSAAQLKTLGELLLELHGQNDGLQLLDERRHLSALDRYAAIEPDEYREQYRKLTELNAERDRLNLDEEEKERLQERLKETVAELEKAGLRDGEREELTARRDLLRNSEKLTEALHIASEALNGEEGALGSAQNAAWQCRHAAAYAAELGEAANSLDQAVFLLTDADEMMRDFLDSLNFSPEEYDRIEQRLREFSRLERKYRRSLEDLPVYLDECRGRLDEISFSEERLQQLEREIRKQDKLCRDLAFQLREKRRAASVRLAEQIEKELHELSMPSARFEVELSPTDTLTATGMDSVRFLLSANRGEPPGRISRIASGGELSRIMLAMKQVLSRGDTVPTMIFDEIDTGVSGIAAQRVGEKLAALSGEKQVLCVTHLPQIASMADRHFVIVKSEQGERTLTEVTQLDHAGARSEIARLHGGDNVTETTLQSAEEQLQYAEHYKQIVKEKKHGSL